MGDEEYRELESLSSNSSSSLLDKLGIYKCKCRCYLENKKGKKDHCFCGRDKSEHSDEDLEFARNNNITKWDVQTCTGDDGTTNAYGEIKFIDRSEDLSKYIRVSHQSDLEKIKTLLFDKSYWGLKYPKLLISVTGGAKLKQTKLIQNTFCKGLVRLASSTNAWITTGGSNNGIMKYMGEAISDNLYDKSKIVSLGITNWLTTAQYESLIRTNTSGNEEPVVYESAKNAGSKGYLNPFHSHFILVDDAQLNTFGGEIEFRSRLEADIAKGNQATKINPIPVVVVVIEGGPNTIRTVQESVKNKIPCVLIDRVGRFSEMFADIYKRVCSVDQPNESNQKFKFDPELRRDVEAMVKVEFAGKNSEAILNIIEEIFDYKNRQYLSVFDLDESKHDKDLDEAILLSILKAGNNVKQTAKLCLSWNREDIAKKFIFTDDYNGDISSYSDLMSFAIQKNRYSYVKLLLENNFPLKSYLTYKCLLKFYNEAPKGFLSTMYKRVLKIDFNPAKRSFAKTLQFDDIGIIIQYLTKNMFEHKFCQLPFKEIEIDFSSSEEDYLDELEDVSVFDNPSMELFLYSILLGRFELADIFWREGQDQISAALLAVKLIKSYATIFEEQSVDLLQKANYYENLACKALQISQELNPVNTEYLLIKRIKEYSGVTCFQIAMSSYCINFLSHPACQNLLVKIWYQNILPDTPKTRLYSSLVCPILAPWLVYFREKKKRKYKAELKEKKQKKKIEKTALQQIFSITETAENFAQNRQNMLEELESEENLYQLEFLEPPKYQSYGQKLFSFLFSPFSKFFYNLTFYLLFLMLFSYVLLCNFFPIYAEGLPSTRWGQISAFEVILIIWVVTMTFDEVREVIISENMTLKSKLRSYFGNFLNMVDFIGLFLFYVGMVLRFIPDYNCYLAARIILCFDIIFWLYRSLNAYAFIKFLGPKLLMIRQMSYNLAQFCLIILVFMIAFGVCTQSLMFPNQPLSRILLVNIFFPSFFVIGGEYSTTLDMMIKTIPSSEPCSPVQSSVNNDNFQNCPDYTGTQVGLAIYVIYLLLVYILLITLLIAIFTKTYSVIEQESDKIWKYERYKLVFEFFHKPVLPPPFVIFYYVYLMFKLVAQIILKRSFPNSESGLVRFLRNRTKIYKAGFYYQFKTFSEEERILRWEKHVTDELVNNLEREKKEDMTFKLQQGIEKLMMLEKNGVIVYQYQNEAKKKLENCEKMLLDAILSSVEGVKKPPKITSRDSSFDKPDSVKSSGMPPVETDATYADKELVSPKANVKQMGSKESVLLSKSDVKVDEKVPAHDPWLNVPDDYKPKNFTDRSILTNVNADLDLLSYPIKYRPVIEYNCYDKKYQLDRTSVAMYRVRDGIPLNPLGPTGVSGRGHLFYWGPNHGIQAVFTRWQLDGQNKIVTDFSGLGIIEVMLKFRKEEGLQLPTLLTENYSNTDPYTAERLIRKVFDEQSARSSMKNYEKLVHLITHTRRIDKYIPKNKKNTDNAWLEYAVVNYHQDSGRLLHDIATNASNKIVWRELNEPLLKQIRDDASVKYLAKIIDEKKASSC